MGKRETIYLAPQCHHQTDSCIKMGSDESHFNASLIERDKITRQRLQTTTFVKRKKSRSVPTSLMCLLLFFSLMSLLLLFSLMCLLLLSGDFYVRIMFVTAFQPNVFVTDFTRFLCANCVCYCFSPQCVFYCFYALFMHELCLLLLFSLIRLLLFLCAFMCELYLLMLFTPMCLLLLICTFYAQIDTVSSRSGINKAYSVAANF